MVKIRHNGLHVFHEFNVSENVSKVSLNAAQKCEYNSYDYLCEEFLYKYASLLKTNCGIS